MDTDRPLNLSIKLHIFSNRKQLEDCVNSPPQKFQNRTKRVKTV